MVLAFVAGFIALQAEIKRRKLKINPDTVILCMALAGIIGGKLWHMVDTPIDRLDFAILQRPVSDLPGFLQSFAWLRSFSTWFVNFFSGGRDRLCCRQDRLPHFGRRRLRQADFASLGHGVSTWPGAHFRRCGDLRPMGMA